jgi:hypothetical protein
VILVVVLLLWGTVISWQLVVTNDPLAAAGKAA